MKRLNKKGFTLVELLAVIVVLSIIMLVVADRVGDAMKTSRTNSFVLQVQSLRREIDKVCAVDNAITDVKIGEIFAGSELTATMDSVPASDGDMYDNKNINIEAKAGSKFANIDMTKLGFVKISEATSTAAEYWEIKGKGIGHYGDPNGAGMGNNPSVKIEASCAIYKKYIPAS